MVLKKKKGVGFFLLLACLLLLSLSLDRILSLSLSLSGLCREREKERHNLREKNTSLSSFSLSSYLSRPRQVAQLEQNLQPLLVERKRLNVQISIERTPERDSPRYHALVEDRNEIRLQSALRHFVGVFFFLMFDFFDF